MDRTRQEMENLMHHVFGQTHPLFRPIERKWRPNVDVFEYDENIVIIVELAGVAREDVSVVFQEGKLCISGLRKDRIPHKGGKYRQMEINYNEFERVVYLPKNVDVDNISAKLNNGFMIIDVPLKRPEGPRSIEWR